MDDNKNTSLDPDVLSQGDDMSDASGGIASVDDREILPDLDVFQHCNSMSDASAEVNHMYETLPAKSFRLLEILPIDKTSEKSLLNPRCRMSIHAMESCPPYVALSYTWGKPCNDCKISLNGQTIKVRKNLWRFLREAKNLKHVKWFWIDALCINQQDYQERGQQVGLMAQIYRNAKSVLVWLGLAYDGSDKAMKGLARTATGKRAAENFWAISGLCNRAYWTRLWIFQEVVLARDITLMCGSKIAPWQPFRAMLIHPPSPKFEASIHYQLARSSPAASIVDRTDGQLDGIELFDLMLYTKDLRCQEPRDRIFALLSTGSRGCNGIVPDYDSPLPLLLNAVLKNYNQGTRAPHNLEEVEDQCKKLDGLFNQGDPSSIFQLQDGKQPEPKYEDMARYPLRRDGSSVSLWWAIYYGHTMVLELLRKDKTVKASESIHQAAQDGNVSIVRLLLGHGIDMRTERDSYNKALQTASNEGHFKMVKLLLESGAEVNARYDDKVTALRAACGSSGADAKVVKLLLDHGAKDKRALMAASQGGHIQLVRLLLEHGADVNGRRDLWPALPQASSHEVRIETALQAASYEGHIEIVELLLEHGANVNGQIDGSDTALRAASGAGRIEVVKLLLANGADVNAANMDYTALQASCMDHHEHSIEIVKLLLQHGADVDAPGGFLGDAQQIASWSDRDDIMKLLIEHRARKHRT